MRERLANSICERVAAAADLYEQLVLVAGMETTTKTAGIATAAETLRAPVVNTSLELSQAMLELTGRQRMLEASRLLAEIVEAHEGSQVFLTNVELLFLPELKIDPLRVLQSLSRHRPVVADWPGPLQDGFLVYAEPEHPEYRKYAASQAGMVIDAPAEG